MPYCVYKHTAPNGKVYIGITSQDVLARWNHGNGYKNNKHFFSAIVKYGWDNIRHEILYDDLTKEDACKKEIELIEEHDSTNPNKGYNSSTGGECGTKGARLSEETRRKMSEARSGEKHFLYGKHPSDEAREKMREAKIGKRISAEHAKILRESRERSVMCIELNIVFPSAANAEKCTGVNATSICNVCKQRRKTAGGYGCKYAE